jgi:hypothetical protein
MHRIAHPPIHPSINQEQYACQGNEDGDGYVGVGVYANAEDLLHGGGFSGPSSAANFRSYLTLGVFWSFGIMGIVRSDLSSIPPVKRVDGGGLSIALPQRRRLAKSKGTSKV